MNFSNNYNETWSEWSANLLSYQYFNQPKNWDFTDYPIWVPSGQSFPRFLQGPFDVK